jgi:hypothetical protein
MRVASHGDQKSCHVCQQAAASMTAACAMQANPQLLTAWCAILVEHFTREGSVRSNHLWREVILVVENCRWLPMNTCVHPDSLWVAPQMFSDVAPNADSQSVPMVESFPDRRRDRLILDHSPRQYVRKDKVD